MIAAATLGWKLIPCFTVQLFQVSLHIRGSGKRAILKYYLTWGKEHRAWIGLDSRIRRDHERVGCSVVIRHGCRRIELTENARGRANGAHDIVRDTTNATLNRAKHTGMWHHDMLGVVQIQHALPRHATPALALRRLCICAHGVIREYINENTLLKPRLFGFVRDKTRACQHNLCEQRSLMRIRPRAGDPVAFPSAEGAISKSVRNRRAACPNQYRRPME